MSVVGGWRNQYGSILDIQSQRSNGLLSGVYSSETGATGCYLMNGWSPPNPASVENQPFSACVAWKPINGCDQDPSWHWASIMSGVIFFDSPTPRIDMLHGLVASTPLPAVEIDRFGVYVESLTFEHIAACLDPPAPVFDDVIESASNWTAPFILTNRDPASWVQKITLVSEAGGRARGAINMPDQALLAWGFVDASPASHLQSLALSTLKGHDGRRSVALGGFIDRVTNIAVLQLFEASAVSYRNKYTAVTAGQETFSVSFGE